MFQILNAVGFFSLFYCFLFSPINLFFLYLLQGLGWFFNPGALLLMVFSC